MVTFSLRRNLRLEEGQVSNMLTEDTCWLGVVISVTFSLRRNL